MEERLKITRNKRFRYGLLLTWIPLLFFLVPSAIGIIRAVVKISGEKATGLAETDSPQTPVELLIILAAIADEGIRIRPLPPIHRPLQ